MLMRVHRKIGGGNDEPETVMKRRSWAITMAGILMMIGGGLLSIISFFSLLMILAGSYGTQSTTLGGFLLIVVAPPTTALAGLGVVLRWRWAWFYLVAGLLVAIGWAAADMLYPSTSPYITPGPVPPIAVVAAAALLLVWSVLPRIRREFGFGHPVRDAGPDLESERFRGSGRGHGFETAVSDRQVSRIAREPATPGQLAALALFVLLLLGFASLMAWQFAGGLETGRISLRMRFGSTALSAERSDDALMFWSLMAVFAVTALLCVGFAAWATFHALRSKADREG